MLSSAQYLLKNIDYNKRDELVVRLGVALASVLFFFCHIFFGVYYGFQNLDIMVISNVVSVCCYVIVFLTNRYRYSIFACFLLVTDLSVYCLLSVYCVGWDIGCQWQVAMMIIPVYLMYQIPVRSRILAIALFILTMMLCFAFRLYVTPHYHVELPLMVAVNFVLCLMGAILGILVLHHANRVNERYYRSEIDSLKYEANKDTLTGIWNRRHAEKTLYSIFTDEYKRESSYVAMIDIDFFKQVNDTYLHDVGDVVLRTLAQHMQRSFRQIDTTARWGGEEFLVILKDTDESGALKALELFRQKIQKLDMLISGHKIHITITIGVAACSSAGDYLDCIKNCDKALYFGKSNGRNQVVNFEGMQLFNLLT